MNRFHRPAAVGICVAMLLLTGCAVPGEALPAPVTQSVLPPAATSNQEQEEVPPMDAENRIWNVKDFDAKGNGRDDDSAALQRAVNTVMRAGGGTVYFPEGTYRISSTLRITMEGDAPLTLMASPAGGVTVETMSDAEGPVLYVNHPYVTLESMAIRQNAPGDQPAVMLMSDHATLNNCSIYASGGNTAPLAKIYGSCNTLTATSWGYANTTPHIVEFTAREGIIAYGNVLEDSYFGGSHTKCVLVTSEDGSAVQEGLIIRRNVFLLPAVGQVEVQAGKQISINDNMLDAGNINILLVPGKAGINGIAITNNYCGASTGGLHVKSDKGGSLQDMTVSANYFWNPDCLLVDLDDCAGMRLTDNYFVKTNGTAMTLRNAKGAFLEGNIVISLGGEMDLSIRAVDDDTVIQNNSLGTVKVPEWSSRFKKLN